MRRCYCVDIVYSRVYPIEAHDYHGRIRVGNKKFPKLAMRDPFNAYFELAFIALICYITCYPMVTASKQEYQWLVTKIDVREAGPQRGKANLSCCDCRPTCRYA